MKSVLGIAGLVVSATLASCGVATTSSSSSKSTTSSNTSKSDRVFPISAGATSTGAPGLNGLMWVLAGNAASKGIFELSVSSGATLESQSVSNSAVALAQSPTGVIGLGIANGGGGAIEFRSGLTGGLLNTVALSGPAIAIAVGNDGKTFYALTQVGAARSVSVVAQNLNKVIATIPVSSSAVSIVPTPSQQDVYVLEAGGFVDEVAISNGQVDGHFPVGHSGYSIAISGDGNVLYVLKGQDPTRNIALVNAATESVRKVISAAANSVAIQLSPLGNVIYDLVGSPSYGNVQAIQLA